MINGEDTSTAEVCESLTDQSGLRTMVQRTDTIGCHDDTQCIAQTGNDAGGTSLGIIGYIHATDNHTGSATASSWRHWHQCHVGLAF